MYMYFYFNKAMINPTTEVISLDELTLVSWSQTTGNCCVRAATYPMTGSGKPQKGPLIAPLCL